MEKQLSLLSYTLCKILFLNAQTNTFPPTGNVGIGTTIPYSKLQVEGRTSVGKSGVLNLDWTN